MLYWNMDGFLRCERETMLISRAITAAQLETVDRRLRYRALCRGLKCVVLKRRRILPYATI
jgi:hypothetical protein